MTKAQIKFLGVVFFVLALWRVFEIPAVSTAFWEFCTVGAIPGSDRELGSDAVLRLLCVVFAVAFFLIFRKEFMASLPERFFHNQPLDLEVVDPVLPIQRTADKIIIRFTKQAERPQFATVRPAARALAMTAIWLVQAMVATEAHCQRLGRYIAFQSRCQATAIYRFSLPVFRRIGQLLIAGYRYGKRAVIRAWKYSEPYIRMLDRWIEDQLRANQYTAEVVHMMDKVEGAIVVMFHRLLNATRKRLAK